MAEALQVKPLEAAEVRVAGLHRDLGLQTLEHLVDLGVLPVAPGEVDLADVESSVAQQLGGPGPLRLVFGAAGRGFGLLRRPIGTLGLALGELQFDHSFPALASASVSPLVARKAK